MVLLITNSVSGIIEGEYADLKSAMFAAWHFYNEGTTLDPFPEIIIDGNKIYNLEAMKEYWITI